MSSSAESGGNDQNPLSLIQGGKGKRDEPFVLGRCSVKASAAAQLALIRQVGVHNRLLWRIASWDTEGPGQESIATETVEFTETEVVTSKMRYYFDVSAVDGAPHKEHPISVWTGPDGFSLPYELGWLHFNGGHVNSNDPEYLDYSFAYNAIAVKGMVFFYTRSPSGRSKETELREIASAVNAGTTHQTGPEKEMGRFLTATFRRDEEVSLAAVAEHGPFFIKLRLTFANDDKLGGMMSDVLRELEGCF